VQANAVNYATVNFWKDMGLQRVILSRELSLDEVEDIRQRCPDIELEVFVHGALCIAYSGRCLLSGYMNHRDSNQGACTNACRWKYNTAEGKETPEGNVIAKTPEVFDPKAETTDDGKVKGIEDKVFLLEEATRPGEYMPAFEDEHGTYIMNSKDLRAVQHVNRFVDMGMDSLKIEGRTKSFFYVSRAVQVYRQAIDNAMSGKPFDINLMDNLESLANRGYTEGFYRRHVKDELQNYETGNSLVDKQQFVGEVLDVDAQGKLVVDVKNRFKVGDKIELMTPKGNHVFHLDGIETEKGESMDLAPGSGWVVKIPVPGGVDPDKALVMRTL